MFITQSADARSTTQNESCSTCNETHNEFVLITWFSVLIYHNLWTCLEGADIKPCVSSCCWEHCLKHYSVYILCYCVRRWRQHSTTWRCFMGKEENTKKQNRCVKELWRSERRWENTRITTLTRKSNICICLLERIMYFQSSQCV